MTNNKSESCLFLFFSFLFILGCSQNPFNDRHAAYFDPVLKKFDTTPYSQIDEAFAYLDSAFYAFPNPSLADIYSYDSAKSVRLDFNKNDYVKAIAYADSMIMICEGRVDEGSFGEQYCEALYQKGDWLRHMKKYEAALQCYQLAQQVGIKYAKDKCKTASYYGSIGSLMKAQQKYLLAARYYLKQFDDYRSLCHVEDYMQFIHTESSLTNAALNYFKVGIFDSAAFYQAKAISIIEANENRFPEKRSTSLYSKAVIYADQADVLCERGKFSEAEDLYQKSIAGTTIPDRQYAQLIQAKLATLYLKLGKKNLMANTLNELKGSLDTLNGETQRMQWLSLKSRYFQLNNQIDSAFLYRKKFDDRKDSIDKRDREFANLDVRSTIENADLKNFNEELERKGKLKNLFIAVATLVVIMAATIATLVWYNLKRTRKLNMQVQQRNRELETAFSSLELSYAENNRLMRIVAHDLKNPISAIKNIMYGLLQKEQPSEKKEMFQAIQASCGNSLSLIHDLLEEKKEQIKKGQKLIDIGNVLENCVQLLQAKAEEKKQRLKLQADHVDIFMNRQKIWRVMNNLITNAIKFSPTKSTIDIRLQKKDNVVLFSVKDNGIGIPDNLKEKIFDMLGEARRAGTEGEESHGLGLSISKKIVEEHEGRLWFESKEHEGSVFYFEIPISA